MKMLVLTTIFFSSVTFAAELRLRAGETVVIQPNTQTTVSCEGGAAQDCGVLAKSLQSIMDACQQSFSPGTCVDKYWPNFKAKNPRCAAENVQYCLDLCEQSYSPGTCADKCQ
jgi:hypothetical protein